MQGGLLLALAMRGTYDQFPIRLRIWYNCHRGKEAY